MGKGMLLRDRSEVSIDSWADLEPGHLLYIDFTLQLGRGRGGSGPLSLMQANQTVTRCCLLALYAPQEGGKKARMWAQSEGFPRQQRPRDPLDR